MHELPITQGILDVVLDHAHRAGATRVTDIHILLGQISSYVDDSIQFYWDIISRDTPAHNARLHFRRVPLEFECRDCAHRFLPDNDSFLCPDCQSPRVRVAGGDELRVEAIDVEGAPARHSGAATP